MIFRQLVGLCSLLLICAWISDSAYAQTQRSGSDTTRVMQQLQQVTAERAKLQSDLDAARKELEQLKSKYSQATAEQERLQQRARDLEQVSSRQKSGSRDAEEQLEKSRAQTQQLLTKYREVTDTLKQLEMDRTALTVQLATQKREMNACVDRNAQMYLLADEVLDRMAEQGVWSALKSRETFTQISRARLENLIEDYRYRVDELKINQSISAR